MPGRRCILEGGRISSLAEVYDELARQLDFPDYFGRNLDALWDILTGELEGPIEIVWHDSHRSRAALGNQFDRVAKVLRDAAAQRPDLVLSLE